MKTLQQFSTPILMPVLFPNTERAYRNKVLYGDCISEMRGMPGGFVDLIITDPPFAIDFGAQRSNYNRKGGRVLEGYNEISANDYLNFTRQWITQSFRVLKENGSMYVFSGWNNLKDILIALDEAGFTTVNHIIWKYQFGVVTKIKYVTSHYHCLFVVKNKKEWKFNPFSRFSKEQRTEQGGSAHYKDKEDVWYIPREYWNGDEKTPTKLPAEVIRKILTYSSDENDLIMDPFLGSGQVAVVAKEMKRAYLGVEIVPEYHDFIRRLLNPGQYPIKSKKYLGRLPNPTRYISRVE